jgi:hypothetical protein
MKEFFLATFRGDRYEFTRVTTTAFDVWYHIRMTEQNDIQYRMHGNKEGNWKITTKRIPTALLALENDFGEIISRNENLTNPVSLQ